MSFTSPRTHARLRTRLSAGIAITAALLLAACGTGSPQATTSTQTDTTAAASEIEDGTLTVLAAASLTESFDELAAMFEKEHPGVDVSTSYAGSQTLVDQLDNGAPADVLATADEKSMQRATEASLVDTPTTFTSNLLAIITPKGNPADVTGMDDSLNNAKLVICAKEVPCGRATATLADKLGLTLTPVSEENKVTDVRARITSGEADAGIVYRTDAKAAGDAVDTIEIAQANEAVNIYPIATVTKAPMPKAAKAFVDFVLSDAGQKVLQEHGFTTVK